MVWIPGGRATIGLGVEEIRALRLPAPWWIDEIASATPRHEVDLAGFFLDRCEVTNAEWRDFLAATGQAPSAALVEGRWPGGALPRGEEQHPISCVTRDDAAEYAEWRGKRLPTEVEWEWAARGPAAYAYPWGDDELRAPRRRALTRLRAVGSFPEDRTDGGVFDLGSGVSEWTSSPFADYPHDAPFLLRWRPRSAEQTFGSRTFGGRASGVVRGSNFESRSADRQAAIRIALSPHAALGSVGFRCAL